MTQSCPTLLVTMHHCITELDGATAYVYVMLGLHNAACDVPTIGSGTTLNSRNGQITNG